MRFSIFDTSGVFFNSIKNWTLNWTYIGSFRFTSLLSIAMTIGITDSASLLKGTYSTWSYLGPWRGWFQSPNCPRQHTTCKADANTWLLPAWPAESPSERPSTCPGDRSLSPHISCLWKIAWSLPHQLHVCASGRCLTAELSGIARRRNARSLRTDTVKPPTWCLLIRSAWREWSEQILWADEK